MLHVSAPAAMWILASLQLVGLASALFARLSEGSSGQSAGQWLFLVSLGLVGLGTMGALSMGPGYWLSSAATLSLMIVTATCDFSRCRERRIEAQV
jgi:hypothetical protein